MGVLALSGGDAVQTLFFICLIPSQVAGERDCDDVHCVSFCWDGSCSCDSRFGALSRLPTACRALQLHPSHTRGQGGGVAIVTMHAWLLSSQLSL